MILWIVGKTVENTDRGAIWEFQGVYASLEKAREACKPGYFIGPATLDQIVPDQTEEWPGSFDPFQ